MPQSGEYGVTIAEWIVNGPVIPVSFPAITGGYTLVHTSADVCGWTIREATGTDTAQVELFDGADPTGVPLARLSIPAGHTSVVSTGFMGVRARAGVHVMVTSGLADGVVWVRIG